MEDLPPFRCDFDRFPIFLDAFLSTRRLLGFEAGVAFTLSYSSCIFPCSLVELLEGIVLGKEANLDLVTGDIQEGRVGEQNLAEDMGRKILKAGTREVDEREGDGE